MYVKRYIKSWKPGLLRNRKVSARIPLPTRLRRATFPPGEGIMRGGYMKVVVKRKEDAIPVVIGTEFIKLQDAMKFANAVPSGGSAKLEIQEGNVTVNGEVCTMRGKKLYPGDKFGFDGDTYLICIHAPQ